MTERSTSSRTEQTEQRSFSLVAVVVGEGGDDLEHLAAHVAEGVVQVQFQVDAVGLHVVAPHGEDPVGVVVAPTIAEEDAGDGVACIGVADGLRGRGGVELEVVGVHRHLGEDLGCWVSFSATSQGERPRRWV